MPKNKPTDGAKEQLQKAKTHTQTAKEAVQCMFSAAGTIDTTMMEHTMEDASELMQDVSKNASDMEMDEQKTRERAPKQNMQETSTVTSDMALPEQEKICNEHKDTPQGPVKALFQAPRGKTTTGNTSNTVSSNMTQVPTKDDVAPPQDLTNLVNQGTNNTSSEPRAIQLGEETASLASDKPNTKVSTQDDVAALQDSTKLVDCSTQDNNTSSATAGATHLENTMASPQDSTKLVDHST